MNLITGCKQYKKEVRQYVQIVNICLYNKKGGNIFRMEHTRANTYYYVCVDLPVPEGVESKSSRRASVLIWRAL